ncbi:hypothetical protein [Sphingobium sp. LSP13-1-1.1]|uniref:hypothetical protein n=1 Tax=Sphingobium sp. LSP13-1-1.1 TaxID=3135234 RepID=UPI0034327625
MVAFPFNMAGVAYQDGIDIIGFSYLAAHDALKSKIDATQEAIDAYEKYIADGGEWEGEVDDEGFTIWSQDQVLELRQREAIEAAITLRKAFVTTLYHHWERHARSWLKNDKFDHAKLITNVRKLNYPVDDDMEILWMLNNLLKHNNSRWGAPLHERRGDLFHPFFKPKADTTHWESVLIVQDRHIQEFINIVKASGPEMSTPAPPKD